MKKNYWWVIILFALLSSCGGRSHTDHKPILTVTIEPLRYFTETIAGDKYKVVSMLPEGTSPETYDPTPGQLVDLGKSQAYFRVGYIGFERAWIKKLQANAPHLLFFDTSRGVSLLKDNHTHGAKEGHMHEGVDPHIWNSPRNAAIMAENIYRALCELDQKNEAYYKHRVDSLLRQIASTDSIIRTELPALDKAFVIYHPALTYFAADYGLRQISIEEEGKEPSPAHLEELIKRCKAEKVKVIFVQQEFDVRNAEVIAKELNVKVVPINPLSYQWQKEMLGIAKALYHPL